MGKDRPGNQKKLRARPEANKELFELVKEGCQRTCVGRSGLTENPSSSLSGTSNPGRIPVSSIKPICSVQRSRLASDLTSLSSDYRKILSSLSLSPPSPVPEYS
jgi:hypothetical protein